MNEIIFCLVFIGSLIGIAIAVLIFEKSISEEKVVRINPIFLILIVSVIVKYYFNNFGFPLYILTLVLVMLLFQ